MAKSSIVTRHPSSFRDPQGYIVKINNSVYRVIGSKEKANYDTLMTSGLYDLATKKELLIKHVEVDTKLGGRIPNLYKLLKPEEIPFISYPYEWSFNELQDAALLTLKLLKLSIEHGMTLKDASAYNVQFLGAQPVFIDTTSFAVRTDKPWEGYKQFCEHFLAPLALMSYNDPYLHRMPRLFIDGIPLSITVSLLPKKARLNLGLLQHLYVHARSQSKHQGAGSKHIEQGKKQKKIPTMSKFKQLAIVDSLERTVKSLRLKKYGTEWGDYYTFTNYDKKSFQAKHKDVEKLIDKCKPRTVWDFGANNGEFSSIAVNKGIYTLAFDIDPIAVYKNYHQFKGNKKMLPLLLDLTNPSPSIGWDLEERSSIVERGPADLIMALALIHHISIGSNIPFDKVAKFFSRCGKYLIIEFVPKGDSKVDTLLSTREDIFDDYNEKGFESAFGKYYIFISKTKILGTKRTLYLMRAK